MVFECRTCGGLVRLEEAMLPRNPTEGLVCPHCGRHGRIVGGDASRAVDLEGKSAFTREVDAVSKDAWDLSSASLPEGAGPANDLEVTPGTFGDSRIMEKKVARLGKNGVFSGWVTWAAVSVAVICMFALLVNLILPGPTGSRLFGGVTVTESSPGR